MTANGYEISFWGDKNILEVNRGDVYATLSVMNCTF